MTPSSPNPARDPEATEANASDWHLFRGSRTSHDRLSTLPEPPPWRPYRSLEEPQERAIPRDADLPPAMRERGRTYRATTTVRDLVNAALLLRRPLLVTGQPGSGKSSLIDAVAYELRMGEPLRWDITSRSTLRDGLYLYDAVGRLQGTATPNAPRAGRAADIARFIRLGPLGTALLPSARPRALLIDEIDKADIDLPNDLLNVLEEGRFGIPELARANTGDRPVHVRTADEQACETYALVGGEVRMREFPFVVLTSNGERSFPPAFLRRCLQLTMPDPTLDLEALEQIVQLHLGEWLRDDPAIQQDVAERIKAFVARTKGLKESLATDQLLNAVFLVSGRSGVPDGQRDALARLVTQALT